MLKTLYFKLRNFVTARPLRKYIAKRINESKFKKLVAMIESQYGERAVLIFQVAMFDSKGEKCFNGGAERYVTDLANILSDCNYEPILVQKGENNNKIWERQVGKLRIFGLPVSEYIHAIRFFKKYKFVIYSGALQW